jgi:integrase|tara:strand:+ start:847 stop:1989 length:1143 start_codon:yes stop_codon:yes gene_type:complete
MNVKIEVHKNNILERKIKLLDKWKVPKETIKEIKEFIRQAQLGQVNEGKRLSDRTISKYLTLLKHSLELIKKETSEITKKDIERFEEKIMKENLKSVSDYRVLLKIFLKWKLGIEKTNEIAGWLDTKQKSKTPDFLKVSEIKKLYKNCKNSSERFLIAVLFDTGSRAEEFLNIRYEDIEMPDTNQNFVKITLKEEYSKTKGRTISLYWNYSLEAISDFLKQREEEGIKSNEQVFNKNYDTMRMFLSRLGKKILNKKIYPHLFRHSSATYYADKMNRQQLCYRYGWTFSSNMPDIYISRAGMNNKELDEKFEGTEITELKNKLDKEQFERKKMQEGFEKLKESDKEFADKFMKFLEVFQKNKKFSSQLAKKDLKIIKEMVD